MAGYNSCMVTTGNMGDVIPPGKDIRGVPLHSEIRTESEKSEHGKDLSAILTQSVDAPPTLADHAGSSTEGMYIGEGLPPVPAKLARRIRAGEFVEMSELLPEVWMRKDEGEPESKRRCGRRVVDIFTWLQCFGIYVSIRGTHLPAAIPEFMAYMSMMVRVNQEYAGTAWLNYDTLFRKHAALKRDTKWSVINTTIYARCFTGAPRNPVKCGICAAASHDTQDCVEGLSPDMSLQQRMETVERQLTQLTPRPRPPIRQSGEVCNKWNREECTFPYCRHTHVCSVCTGPHPASRCPRRGRQYVSNQAAAPYLRNGRQAGGP